MTAATITLADAATAVATSQCTAIPRLMHDLGIGWEDARSLLDNLAEHGVITLDSRSHPPVTAAADQVTARQPDGFETRLASPHPDRVSGTRVPDLCAELDVSYRRVDYWLRNYPHDLLDPSAGGRAAPGSGQTRTLTAAEVDRITRMHRLVVGGLQPRHAAAAARAGHTALDELDIAWAMQRGEAT